MTSPACHKRQQCAPVHRQPSCCNLQEIQDYIAGATKGATSEDPYEVWWIAIQLNMAVNLTEWAAHAWEHAMLHQGELALLYMCRG